MLVAIADGHGKIARRLTRLLVAHGQQVRGWHPTASGRSSGPAC